MKLRIGLLCLGLSLSVGSTSCLGSTNSHLARIANEVGQLRVAANKLGQKVDEARASVPKIPIQMLRVVQVETYTQEYTFKDRDTVRNVFERILGPCNMAILYAVEAKRGGETGRYAATNLAKLEDVSPGVKQCIEDIKPPTTPQAAGAEKTLFRTPADRFANNQVLVKGSLTLVILPNQANPAEFMVEGWGRYFVYSKVDNQELLASAQFSVDDDHVHSAAELEKNLVLDIPIKQWAVREFLRDQRQYVHESRVLTHIVLKSPIKGIYEIDYSSREHEIRLADMAGTELIGRLRFDRPPAADKLVRKLLDVRGLESPNPAIQGGYPELEKLHWRTGGTVNPGRPVDVLPSKKQ